MNKKTQKKINLQENPIQLQKRTLDDFHNDTTDKPSDKPTWKNHKVNPNHFKKIKQGGFKRQNNSNEKPQDFEVFVGKLPFDATEKQLSDFFSSCGKIVGVKILFHKDGKSKGRGFVKFADQQGVDRASLLNDALFQTQKIKVGTVKTFDELFKDKQEKEIGKLKEYVPPEQKYEGVESSTLLIRNLDYCVTNDMLADLFKNSRGYLGTRLILNQAGQNRGFGFIEFIDTESAKLAFSLSNSLLGRKKIFIEFSAPKHIRKDPQQGQQQVKHSAKLEQDFKGEVVDL